ncbi:MAG: glycogen synthase [Chloroflexi bacterium]|nr:glycogen synthase [Chloroflexota bacterium]MBL7061611.1 glycogen synthase [Dehalococcoidia bacterium]
MKILFVAAEATPLVKVGGLADVIGSLPKALVEIGHDVRVIMPGYGIIDPANFTTSTVIGNLNIAVMGRTEQVSLKVTELGTKVRVYLVDSDDFRNSIEVYGKGDLERFLLFCRAVLDILSKLDWQPEIVHCHDWHTALIPLWLKKNNCHYASIFTIHNLAYQGFFDARFLIDADLEKDWQLRPTDMPDPPLNFMGQGILWADMVTTVSETYAKEILTPEYGAGLDHLLRYRQDKLFGIVNGLDYDEYNPAIDDFIPAKYDVCAVDKRIDNKRALQKRARFAGGVEVPLIGMVSRLDEQKGLDILTASFDILLQKTEAQMFILGRGREEYHNLLRQAASRYPEQLAVFIDFDDTLARLIYAGCDMFLMPSRFEPCGLGQLIAMRYGAVPVVHHTGGLADTVQDLTQDMSKGSGFVFQGYDSEAMLAAIQRAVNSYTKKAWQNVMRRIMALDFSWHASAKRYESIYRKALELKNS